MKRIKLIVAYDGTNYSGWQVQPNALTIEEVLNKKLTELLGESIQVTGASRTDSGVHSLGNIAIFDTNTKIPAEKISYALNQRLPDDIVVQNSCEVPKDFHPRYVKSRKTYEYRILNAAIPMPSLRKDTYFTYRALDVEKMKEAAAYLVGEHDFKSFCSANAQVKDTVRNILSITISCESVEHGICPANGKEPFVCLNKVVKQGVRLIRIRVTGTGFLYNMVRIIAGTLLSVGMGDLEPESLKEIIQAKDRNAAGPTAPACGLTMIGICIEE